jgi:hypothetical protein
VWLPYILVTVCTDVVTVRIRIAYNNCTAILAHRSIRCGYLKHLELEGSVPVSPQRAFLALFHPTPLVSLSSRTNTNPRSGHEAFRLTLHHRPSPCSGRHVNFDNNRLNCRFLDLASPNSAISSFLHAPSIKRNAASFRDVSIVYRLFHGIVVTILATCFREKITEFGVIALDIVNWFVIVKLQKCVYCVVRNKLLCIVIRTSGLTIFLLTWRIWRAPCS